MSEDLRRHFLARIIDDPYLARAVQRLQPQILHAVITHAGLEKCGDLLALATAEQLSNVLDLDLWKADRPGADEQFDAARFCEWIEVLVDASPTIAAEQLAKIDVALIVAGLSPNVRIFDLAVFAPDGEPTGADTVSNAARELGIHAEIGGFIVVARRTDAWDAIVDVLFALYEHHSETFARVMRGCRTLTNSGFELDGLDDLLSDVDQARFDLSSSREQRGDRLGFLPPQQARTFLDSARRITLTAEPPRDRPVFTGYQRSRVVSGEEADASAESALADVELSPAEGSSAVARVIEVLRGAGVLAEPRALLPGAHDDLSLMDAALNDYLRLQANDAAAWTARNEELAFLANALVAGCSVQGRPFARREAVDAVAATCNLGLECWPSHWLAASAHDLVTVFQVGWVILHHEVSMATADRLLSTLDDIRIEDEDLQRDVYVLRRELLKQRKAGTPWHARDRLDVLAIFDLPACAALAALFDECPVMLANVCTAGGRQPLSINPADFRFIAYKRDLVAIQQFLGTLTDRLAS